MNHKLPPGHPKLVTRRQFVGHGMLQAASSIMVPSILDLCLRPDKLFASDACPSGGMGNVSLPLIVFDLVGGASLAGNFVVGTNQPLDLLASYSRLGVPQGISISTGITSSEFGLPMWNGTYTQALAPNPTLPISGIYAGMTEYPVGTVTTTAATRLRTVMGSITCTARDDSDMNPLNPLHIIWKAGLSGKYLTGAGTAASLSGGYSRATLADSRFKPVRVTNLASLFNVLGLGSTLGNLSAAKKDRLRRLVQSLSNSQADKLAAMNYGAEYKSIVDCVSLQNAEYVSLPVGVDCRQDANVRQIFGISTNTDPTLASLAVPSIAYNVLNGNIGAATIEIPDADYHASKSFQQAFDAEVNIGRTIGRVLQLAMQMQKRLFFAIVTDGANISSANNRDWQGDDGTKCLAIVGFIDPFATSKPKLANNQTSMQIGTYKDVLNADGSHSQSPNPHFLSADPDLVAKAIALNYFSGADMRGKFRDIIPTSAFPSDKEDSSIITLPLTAI